MAGHQHGSPDDSQSLWVDITCLAGSVKFANTWLSRSPLDRDIFNWKPLNANSRSLSVCGLYPQMNGWCIARLGSLRSRLHGRIGIESRDTRFLLPIISASLCALARRLLLRMQCLRGGNGSDCLTVQVQARCVLDHAFPIPASSAPRRDTQFELFVGYSE